jgi:hypothetical protein
VVASDLRTPSTVAFAKLGDDVTEILGVAAYLNGGDGATPA